MIDRVLISGGSGGIGGAMALACAARGAWPLVGYCANERLARETVRRGGAGETVRIDLEREDLGLAGCLPAAGAVVHCAGAYIGQRSLAQSSSAEVRRLLEINALGPLRLTQALLTQAPGLRHVVFVLSTAVACRGTGPYPLSKAAGLAVCKLLANELTPRGIRVDAIVPGWTDTEAARSIARATGRSLDEIRSQHLDGRILAPSEVGELCAQLLFDVSARPGGHLVVWDRRDARNPVWLGLGDMLALTPDHNHPLTNNDTSCGRK
ncbi:MAG TPA: SDR family oxidoreductase [Pirellulales bacterium]|nr:SDR family oxidoreductase [Pirellulales bacterium]